MLRLKLLPRPLAVRLKLQTHKVADIPVHAISDRTLQRTLRMEDFNYRVRGNRSIDLDAGAGSGDILKQRSGLPAPPGLVLPANVDEVGTKHPRFGSLTQHMSR